MSRRKGTPCACECDPCGSSKCIKAINNVSGDPNGDFEIKAGNGIGISQSGDNSITIINQSMASSFVAGDNIEINPSGNDLEIRLTDNPVINGTLQINGDIIQQGAAYETHAEKVYTTNDYIYMRDGAITGLGSGDYSGFQVKKYDGTNDGRLVIDKDGVARVGDVGDEQPLLTRAESANLTSPHLLRWSGSQQRAVDAGVGVNDLVSSALTTGALTPNSTNFSYIDLYYVKFGKLVAVNLIGCTPLQSGGDFIVAYNLPKADAHSYHDYAFGGTGSTIIGNMWINPSDDKLNVTVNNTRIFWKTFFYFAES